MLAALQAGRDAVRASGGASAETTHMGDSDAERTPGEREAVSNADALLLMADTVLATGDGIERSGAERYQVVVHVDAPVLAGSPADDAAAGACAVEEGPVAASRDRPPAGLRRRPDPHPGARRPAAVGREAQP